MSGGLVSALLSRWKFSSGSGYVNTRDSSGNEITSWPGTEFDDGDTVDTNSQGTLIIGTEGGGGANLPGTARAINVDATGDLQVDIKTVPGAAGAVDTSMAFTTETAATAVSFAASVLTFQLISDGSHGGTSIVEIQGSNDNAAWVTLATITVTDTNDTDALSLSNMPWKYIRGECIQHGDDTNSVTLKIGT